MLADDFAGAVKADVDREADSGRRVLVLARTEQDLAGERRPEGLVAVALVLLVDRIRPDAPETLNYFAEQGVTLKVISGDNPRTVAAVASRAGLANASALVDARDLPDDPEAMADMVVERHGVRPGQPAPEASHGARPPVTRPHRRHDR